VSGSIKDPPLATIEAKLLLYSSSLMTLPMLENYIPEASSIGLRSPKTSLLSSLFTSSTSTCGRFLLLVHRFVLRKNLLLGHLTGNTTNTVSLLLGLQGLAEGVVFTLTI
jgi:hypothetical protein